MRNHVAIVWNSWNAFPTDLKDMDQIDPEEKIDNRNLQCQKGME